MHAFVISPIMSRVHNEVRDVVARRWTVQIRHVFSSEFKTKFKIRWTCSKVYQIRHQKPPRRNVPKCLCRQLWTQRSPG
jgi:hypothetical protein